MKRVIIESPYINPRRTEVEKNVAYARSAVQDCIAHDESPIASHLLFPGALLERDRGIEAGLAWRFVADLTAFYTDRGWSQGMLRSLRLCVEEMREFELRALAGPVRLPVGFGHEKLLEKRSRK